MTDNQIDRADCSNRAAERDSFSDAKMQRAEFTFMNAFLNLVKNKAPIAPMSPAASSAANTHQLYGQNNITARRTFLTPLCGRRTALRQKQSFDHLVGQCEQFFRHVEAERLGGLEV